MPGGRPLAFSIGFIDPHPDEAQFAERRRDVRVRRPLGGTLGERHQVGQHGGLVGVQQGAGGAFGRAAFFIRFGEARHQQQDAAVVGAQEREGLLERGLVQVGGDQDGAASARQVRCARFDHRQERRFPARFGAEDHLLHLALVDEAPGGDLEFGLVGEQHQADVGVGAKQPFDDGAAQFQGPFEGVLFAPLGAELAAVQVDEVPRRFVGQVLVGDRLAHARRRFPVHVAEAVAGHELT